MNSAFLWIASFLAFLTFCVHVFVGGVFVAKPLLQDETLPKASKWLNYYCWHIVSVYLMASAIAFGYAAFSGRGIEMVVTLSGLGASFSALSSAIAIKGGIHPFRFPSTTLFALTAVFGAMALIYGA